MSPFFDFVVHKSSHPLFLWESNFQFNFLSCETGVMVFTNPFRPVGSAVLLPHFCAGKFSQLSLETFLPLLSSAGAPLALAHAALVVPCRRCAGHLCGVQENKTNPLFSPLPWALPFPVPHPAVHIDAFGLLLSTAACCSQALGMQGSPVGRNADVSFVLLCPGHFS